MIAGPNGSGKSEIKKLLPGAIAASDRAFLFDNSGAKVEVVAEVTDGTIVTTQKSTIPN